MLWGAQSSHCGFKKPCILLCILFLWRRPHYQNTLQMKPELGCIQWKWLSANGGWLIWRNWDGGRVIYQCQEKDAHILISKAGTRDLIKQNRVRRSGIIKDLERRIEPGGPDIIPRSQQVKEGDRRTTEKDNRPKARKIWSLLLKTEDGREPGDTGGLRKDKKYTLPLV